MSLYWCSFTKDRISLTWQNCVFLIASVYEILCKFVMGNVAVFFSLFQIIIIKSIKKTCVCYILCLTSVPTVCFGSLSVLLCDSRSRGNTLTYYKAQRNHIWPYAIFVVDARLVKFGPQAEKPTMSEITVALKRATKCREVLLVSWPIQSLLAAAFRLRMKFR